MKLICYIRALFALPAHIFVTAFSATLVIIAGGVFKSQNYVSQIIHLWACALNFLVNIHVKLRGKENLPEGGCIYLFNHTSGFDITAVHQAIPGHVRFGAKAELFRVPIFGQGMRASGGLEIYRTRRGQVLDLYKNSVARVLKGECFALAAEGTRQSVAGVGERFKAGPFIFAITGQFPIVPVVIRGAFECLPKGKWLPCIDKWRHEIILQVLPPVSTKGLTLEDRQELQRKVQNLMTIAYNRG
ncbi:MAG: 1-acyl-sn-glycerol-3-phosphate acyltransferase [Bdellovibrionales bacterium]|nr:1-acyl-sn-glycerol-3-phosphate acyltransferase [Bdellovibrionales bacterium]